MINSTVSFACLAGTHDFCAREWKDNGEGRTCGRRCHNDKQPPLPSNLMDFVHPFRRVSLAVSRTRSSGTGIRLWSVPGGFSGEHLLCRPARRAEHEIFDNSLDFGPKQKVSGGVSAFSRTVLLRSMSVERLEGKGYRSRLSIAGAPSRIVLARKERAMIRMVADCASPQFIAQRLELEEMQLRAALDSVFAKLAMSGRLDLLSRKGC
jgi:DNA-binding CsgD family transcriptional regulator